MRSIISPMTFQACSYLRNGILVLPSAQNILLSSLWALWVSICLPVCIWVYHLCFSLFHQSGWGLMSMSDSHVFVWLPSHHHFSLSSAVISSSPFPAIIVKVPLLPNTNTQLPSILLLYFFFIILIIWNYIIYIFMLLGGEGCLLSISLHWNVSSIRVGT